MRPIHKIILHCSATRSAWMADEPFQSQVDEIRKWHVQDNGWSDIGYHWLVSRSGDVLTGRPESKVGAHVRGQNKNSIGICLIGGGGSEAGDKPAEHFTPVQMEAARRLITEILERHPNATVHGHNEFAAKACPGFQVDEWWSQEAEAPMNLTAPGIETLKAPIKSDVGEAGPNPPSVVRKYIKPESMTFWTGALAFASGLGLLVESVFFPTSTLVTSLVEFLPLPSDDPKTLIYVGAGVIFGRAAIK